MNLRVSTEWETKFSLTQQNFCLKLTISLEEKDFSSKMFLFASAPSLIQGNDINNMRKKKKSSFVLLWDVQAVLGSSF